MRQPRYWVLMLAACAAGGCGGDPWDVGRTVPVAGRVTLEGRPLSGGMVLFQPDRGRGNACPHEPRGTIDAEGNYQLTTCGRDGAPPGWYRVAVIAEDPAAAADPTSHGPPRWLVPPRYVDAATSGLALDAVEEPAPGAYDLSIRR